MQKQVTIVTIIMIMVMVMIMIMIWTRGVTSLPSPTLQHYPPAITVTTVTFGWYHIIPTHKPGIQSSLSNLSLTSLSVCPSVCLSVSLGVCRRGQHDWRCLKLSLCFSSCPDHTRVFLSVFPCVRSLLAIAGVESQAVRQAGKLKQEEQGQTRALVELWQVSGTGVQACPYLPLPSLSVLLFYLIFTSHLSHESAPSSFFLSFFVRPSAWPHVRIHPTELSEPTKDAT